MTLDAPTTLVEFQRAFHDEGACLDYLVRVRWPEGFECPHCGAGGSWLPSRRLFECHGGHQTSPTAGTVMHRSKMPICTWFQAAYLVSTLTPGISALQFQKQMGISRYETAFQMLHKLRSALVAPDREPLHGTIEVDEAFVGGTEAGVPGRGAETKALVVVAVEVVTYFDTGGKGQRGHERAKAPEVVEHEGQRGVWRKRAGRVRMSVLPDASARSLLPWVKANVATGAHVLTDGWAGYGGLAKAGYQHERILQSHKGESTGDFLPMVHLIISNLKTWLKGTHKGAVLPKHLQAYLNEYAFRFNRRFWRGPAFLRALGLVVEAPHGRPEYTALYGGRWQHPDPQGPSEAVRFVEWLRGCGEPGVERWIGEHPREALKLARLVIRDASRGHG